MILKTLVSFNQQASPQEIYAYQRKVGSLLYAGIMTRPDVAYAAGRLSEFLQNPSPKHIAAIDRAIAYLCHTRYKALEFGGNDSDSRAFEASSDAAYADDPETRKSTQGFLIPFFGGAVDWKSVKQKTVVTSSTEAELLALSKAAKEIYWWKRLMAGILFNPDHEISLNVDNQQAIRLVTTTAPRLITRLKHIDVHQLWVRQEVQAGKLATQWVPTGQMRADGLTKALIGQKHENFLKHLNMTDIGKKLSKN